MEIVIIDSAINAVAHMRFFFTPKSFNTSLAIWFAGLSIVLVLVVSQAIDWVASQSINKLSREKLSELAYQISDKLDRGMFERYREVTLLAQRNEWGDLSVPLAQQQRLLDKLQATYPLYAWIGLADNSGQVQVATRGLLQGADVSKRPWFINAQHGSFVGDLHEAKLLANKLPRINGEPMRFIDVAFPYENSDHERVGILGVHMSWEWAKDLEQSVISPAQQHNKVEALIISREGKVILGPPFLKGTILSPELMRYFTQYGNSTLVRQWDSKNSYVVGISATRGYGTYPGLGWIVIVRQTTSEAFAAIRHLQQTVIVIGLISGFLFSLFGIFNARRITKSLRQLAHSAQQIQAGKATHISLTHQPHREILQLHDSLNALITGLNHSQNLLKNANLRLEHRVEERTAQLIVNENRLRMLANHMPVSIAHFNKEARFQFCNQTFERWFESSSENILGAKLGNILGFSLYEIIEPYLDQVLTGESVTVEFSRSYQQKIQHLQASFIPDDSGGFYSLMQDITVTQSRQQLLEHELKHDVLTGLPNRLACMSKIDEAMARARRSTIPIGVMFLDLNKFKEINDNFGHDVGDQVLKEFAQRLKNSMRETDTVARLSGDEFVVIAENLVHGPEDALRIVAKILDALLIPVVFGRFNQMVRTSIGVALYLKGAESSAALLKRADEAMYQNKKHGINDIAFNPPEH